MNLLDRCRILSVSFCYDFWLEYAGVPGPRRRDLRRELRANLGDATARIGSRAAVRGLGGIREMAASAYPADSSRPRWVVGSTVGIFAFAVTIFGQFLAALSWLDGVIAATPQGTVTGAMTFYPGSSLTYDPVGQGFGFSLDFGWTGLVIGLIVGVLAAQPWRILRRLIVRGSIYRPN